MRLWENVRNLTLQSTAPALVYEEGSLIKRSIRDLYNKDIDEILVSGEEGYREAKDFMRMLMPSHAKVVQPFRDTTPIFVRNGIEAQLDRMLQPQVTLKSGGYIIINQTEALVAIDVNSGRSTKEHSIEDTALHTNLEAAEEVARQLRLRDLAGLIVIDFIDMEENRNNRSVEKRLKDHLKNDRARIQVGRISHFGLMEMSRQRIRASVLESTMKPCPHCGGTGHVRSDSSVALMVVRAIEEFLLKDSRSHITVRTPAATALYVLNHKRGTLVEFESRFGLTITIEADDSVGAQHYAIFRGALAEKPEGFIEARSFPAYVEPEEPEDEIVIEEEDEAPAQAEQPRQRRSSHSSSQGPARTAKAATASAASAADGVAARIATVNMAPRRTVLPSPLRRAISPNRRALRAIATRKRMTTLLWVLPKHLKRLGPRTTVRARSAGAASAAASAIAAKRAKSRPRRVLPRQTKPAEDGVSEGEPDFSEPVPAVAVEDAAAPAPANDDVASRKAEEEARIEGEEGRDRNPSPRR